jgi:hypothetical protein
MYYFIPEDLSIDHKIIYNYLRDEDWKGNIKIRPLSREKDIDDIDFVNIYLQSQGYYVKSNNTLNSYPLDQRGNTFRRDI